MIDLTWRSQSDDPPTLRISMPTNQQTAPPGAANATASSPRRRP